jgi:regulator of nucleoside diphosphate kinase
MPLTSIRLTTSDRHRLFVLLARADRAGDLDRAHASELESELREADVVAPEEAPPDLVTMRTTVRLRDLGSGEASLCTLVYPEEADRGVGRISVLEPLGAALLGKRAGDTVDISLPGAPRRVWIDEIVFQPEAAGRYDL